MTNQEAIEVLSGILAEAIEFENSVCYVTGEDREPLEMAIEALKNQKTGHWIYIGNSQITGLKIVECSECGNRTYGSGKFCPNCGAKMKGE